MSDASRSDTTATTDTDQARHDRRQQMARALARGGMDGVHVISRGSATELLTPKRQELITYLAENEVGSVRDLARQLDRDKGQVSRDLETLARHGVVDFDTEGRAKQPYLQHDHVVVEPVH